LFLQLDFTRKLIFFNIFINSNGVKVRGYFVWAAFDTFEFEAGYSGHWGLYHIDFNNSLKRVPKASAKWYRNFLTSNCGH
jgi:beta-glucosidase